MTASGWVVPAAMTAAIWAWGLKPMPRPNSGMDLTDIFSAIFKMIICIIATLLFWLIFVAVKSAL
jgi:hypothetical protein